MAFNRELSQFANYLALDASANYIGITTSESTNIGFGKANPTSKIDVVGDGNFTGVVTATSFTGDLTGNADTASALQTARVIELTGDVAGSISFDGSSNVSIAATIQANSVTLGDDTTGDYVADISDAGSGNITVSGSGENASVTLDLGDTTVTPGSYGSSTEIPTFTVDAKGRLTAAGTASVGTALTVAGDSGSELIDLLSESLTIAGGTNLTSSAASNTVTINLDNDINVSTVNASGIVTAAQFKTGATGSAIGINTNTISGPAVLTIDPAAVGDDTGLVVIKGDLQVDGTQTIINSTTVTVNDKNIQVADGAINDAAADGAGFTVNSGDGNKTFQFNDANNSFQSNIALDVASGQVYKINGTEVLSSDTLGSGVVNSSLTSVGTLGQLNVSGVTTSSGGFSGNLTGDVTGNADTATALQTARDFSASGDASASAVSFDGTGNVDLALTLANTGVTTGSYGSSSEIPTFTVDSKGRLTAAGSVSVSTGMTVAGDSGSETINLLSETLTIAGGTNLTSSAASDTVTINLDDNISLVSVTASGIVTATSGFVGNLTGDVTGNADTATALETARDFSASGDASASAVSFDGTGNVDLVLTLADTAVTPGSYGSSTEIPTFTVDSKGRLTAAGTASVGTALTVVGDSGSEVIDLLSETLTIAGGTNLTSSAASDTVTISLDNDINVSTVNASGIVTAAQFVTGASGSAIGINTNTISGPATITIDPAGVGDNTGLVVIKGDLQIDGTTTTVNSTTITVDDKNILLASGAANDAAADGGGITVESGDGNKTWNWVDSTDSWTSSEHIDVASGKVYKVNGTEVLSSNTLGSGVVNSSLTSVGTLGQLSVSGVTTSSGGFVGDLTGNVTGNVTGDVYAGIVTATSGFTGDLTGNVTGNVTGDLTGSVTGNVTGNLTGNVYASSGISTFNNIDINGTLTDGNDGVGTSGQILISVGTGVSWRTLTDALPQTRTTDTQTATNGQTAFSFNYNVNYLDVFVNGVKLSSNDYTASNGTDITLSEAAFAGDTVEFHSYNTVGAGAGSVSSLNDLSDVTLTSSSAGNLISYNGSAWINTNNLNVGVITATAFYGDGSGLTGAGSTVADETSDNATYYPVFTQTTTGTITASNVSTTKLTFNPSTGTLSATNVNTTSDINLKKDVSVFEGALGTVQKLEGVNFTWKDSDQKTVGVIAQQIEEHLPQLIDNSAEYKSVNYNGLVGVLIEAVKEQQVQIEALKAEIEELKK